MRMFGNSASASISHMQRDEQTDGMEQQHQKTMEPGGFTAVNKASMAAHSHLLTPPEHTLDTFSSQREDQASQPRKFQVKLPPINGHTPPASPETKILPSLAQVATRLPQRDIADPPLFPEEQRQSPESQAPLFRHEREYSSTNTPPKHNTSDDGISDGSIKETITGLKQKVDRDAGFFPDNLGVRLPHDAVQYLEDRLRELYGWRNAVRGLPDPVKASRYSPRDPVDLKQLGRLRADPTRPVGITKVKSPPKQAVKPKAPAAASSATKPLPPRKRTPKARLSHDFSNDGTAQQTAKHKRAPPSKKVEHDNVSWSELPDYAPSLATLDTTSKPLKATWHGTAVDLSNDPDRDHLHPQELAIAGTLRLTCAQYLGNKRKIFQARLQSIREGKNFTKTAAQGACSIDVNKASQLWEAFDKVGWFKEEWFQQWL